MEIIQFLRKFLPLEDELPSHRLPVRMYRSVRAGKVMPPPLSPSLSLLRDHCRILECFSGPSVWSLFRCHHFFPRFLFRLSLQKEYCFVRRLEDRNRHTYSLFHIKLLCFCSDDDSIPECFVRNRREEGSDVAVIAKAQRHKVCRILQ